MKNIVSSWKTTVLGLGLVLASVFSVFYVESIDWDSATIPLIIGVLLMFSPDTLVEKIQCLISSKSSRITAEINNIPSEDETPSSATKPDQPE